MQTARIVVLRDSALSSRQRIRVENTSVLSYQAVLSLDGRQLIHGNRSRLVLLAGMLAENMDHMRGQIELVQIRASLLPRAANGVTWDCIDAGKIWFAVCFGGVELVGIEMAGMRIPRGREVVTLRQGTRLELTLLNPQAACAEALVVLGIEYGGDWGREVTSRIEKVESEATRAKHLARTERE